jgi:putative tryptophan/tyrosine transport system substrate-binding protein
VASIEWQTDRKEKDMREKITILILCVMLFALYPASARSQSRLPTIGWLGAGPGDAPARSGEFVRRELNKLGYVEGRNMASEYRNADNSPERLPALADELARLKVDLIYAGGSTAARAAKDATKTIPIVFINVNDPVPIGLVDSLARPGGNVTGFYSMADVLAGKRLEVLKESIPKLSRVAVLWYPTSGSNEPQWTESQLAARHLGLQLHSMKIGSTERYETAFKEATKTGSTALALIRHRLSHTTNQKRILELAAKYRLPAIYYREDFVEQGGLMSYGADEVEPFKRVAVMVDKILKGTKPADIPVEQSTKFEFVINLKTTKQLGLTIPPNVLARADKVIR